MVIIAIIGQTGSGREILSSLIEEIDPEIKKIRLDESQEVKD